MVKAIPMEDWLRGCVYHDGRHGEVTLSTDKVLEIANYIQLTRTSLADGMIELPPYEPQTELKGSKRLLKGTDEPQTESNTRWRHKGDCLNCAHWEHGAHSHYYCALLEMGQECFFESKDESTLMFAHVPQMDGYMTAEQTADYRKMLDNAEHKVYGNIFEDEPQACDNCRFDSRYGIESICTECSRHYSDCYALTAEQSDIDWKDQMWAEAVEQSGKE